MLSGPRVCSSALFKWHAGLPYRNSSPHSREIAAKAAVSLASHATKKRANERRVAERLWGGVDLPKVDEANPPIGQQHHVAGVRVAGHEPLAQYEVAERAAQRPGSCRTIDGWRAGCRRRRRRGTAEGGRGLHAQASERLIHHRTLACLAQTSERPPFDEPVPKRDRELE
eukprot:3018370-Prymnesium_polylepis.1